MADGVVDVCGVCDKKVKENEDAVFCEDVCFKWHHIKCVGISIRSYKALQQGSKAYKCDKCKLEQRKSAGKLQDAIEALKVSVEELKKDFEKKMGSLTTLVNEVNTLKSDVQYCAEKIKTHGSDINTLYDYNNELEQYSKNYDVVIRGIPLCDSENCTQIVKKIGQVVGCDITDRD